MPAGQGYPKRLARILYHEPLTSGEPGVQILQGQLRAIITNDCGARDQEVG